MKTILVACDGSGHSDRALVLACDLSLHHATGLHILGVREPGGPSRELAAMAKVEHVNPAERHGASPAMARVPSWMMDGVDAVRRSGETTSIADLITTQVLERARQVAESHGVTGITLLERSGPAAAEILHCIRELDADTVIMGTRGLGRLKSAMLGSVSRQVTHDAPRHCTCITVATGAGH